MPLTAQRTKELQELCRQFRIDVIQTLYNRQTGHAGGSLSVCEILAALYLECANISPDNLEDNNRDRIILCKGHAAPMLYRLLCEKGILPLDELATLRQPGSRLQGHPCAHKTPGVELSTGPLGLGLAGAVGMACVAKEKGWSSTVFPVLGDGELNEGTVWEAAMAAAKFQLNNLVAVVDWNKVQLDGPTSSVMPTGDLEAKWSAFGWKAYRCDGHDIAALCDTIRQAKAYSGGPAVVLADTVKGKGVSFMEGNCAYHGKALSNEEYTDAMAELGGI